MTKRLKVAIFSLLVIILTSYISYSILEHRMMGVEVVKNDRGRYVIATDVPPGYWGYGRILVGDIIDEINGEPPSSFYSVKKYSAIEKASTIQLLRQQPDGTMKKILLYVDRGIASEDLIVELIIPLSAVILFSGLSWFVYHRKKEDKAAIYLILFFLSTGMAYLSSFSSGRIDPVGSIVLVSTFSLVPVFFLQFLNEYLKRYQEPLVSRTLFVAFYGMAGLFLIVDIIQMLSGFDLLSLAPISPLLVFFMLVNLYTIYKLIHKFAIHRRDSLRALFKLTLMGHMLGFLPFILLFGVPQLFGVTLLTPQIASIFLLTIPMVYLYMFTTRQLFDIDFLLNRLFYYISIAFIPTLLITTCGILITIQHNYSWVKWVQMFMVVYLMLTLFLFYKEYVDFRLRPSFNKNFNSFQGSLDRFSTRISRVMKREDLERVLEKEILSILLVKKVAFLEVNKERVPGHHPIADSKSKEVPVAVISALKSVVHKLAIGETVTVPIGLCVVLGQKGSTFHVLWLDDKESRTKYNMDELGWLRTLANYSAIVYENLYLIESLIEDLESEFKKQRGASPWVMRLIFNLSELERRRLAADLHDSALQDQLIWYRKLEAVMLDHNLSPGLHHELEAVREGLLDVIHQIRETCNEMRPPLLKEMGIVEALEQLFEQAQIRSNYVIDFQVKGHIVDLNDEQTLTLFRIVQELLRNANKHAKASAVSIELEQQEEIRLVYKDNGIGMELAELNDSYQHMGLSGIKERVRSLEGEIDFHSVVGEGLEVHIMLPLESASITEEGGDETDDQNLVS